MQITRSKKSTYLIYLGLYLGLFFSVTAVAQLHPELERLQQAYPGWFKISLDRKNIIWRDGTIMPVQNNQIPRSLQEKIANPSLIDQVSAVKYPTGKINLAVYFSTQQDPGRIRYEPFARKMYGNSEDQVRSHLKTLAWMPHIFKKADGSAQYNLLVTTVNQVDKKLQCISDELEQLVHKCPAYKKYLAQPGGTFAWRNIANTNRLSYHSFGSPLIYKNLRQLKIINGEVKRSATNHGLINLIMAEVLSHGNRPVPENAKFAYYPNHIPWPIVLIFEKYGFIWGGKWYHYDTMHFEYRPEIVGPEPV